MRIAAVFGVQDPQRVFMVRTCHRLAATPMTDSKGRATCGSSRATSCLYRMSTRRCSRSTSMPAPVASLSVPSKTSGRRPCFCRVLYASTSSPHRSMRGFVAASALPAGAAAGWMMPRLPRAASMRSSRRAIQGALRSRKSCARAMLVRMGMLMVTVPSAWTRRLRFFTRLRVTAA